MKIYVFAQLKTFWYENFYKSLSSNSPHLVALAWVAIIVVSFIFYLKAWFPKTV